MLLKLFKTGFVFFLLLFLFSCKSKPETITIEELGIKEPVFEVVSIIILQADLVVTEFETVLKVTNPNNFAVELKAMTYELFGNGAPWARGAAADMLRIEPLSTGETSFIFSMNFINMNRRLLDDVIALRPVNYRLRGEAEVQPLIRNIRPFRMTYDRTGLSDVRRN